MRASSSSKNNKEQVRTLEEELDHQIKKSNLLEIDRTTFWKNAEETKERNKDMIKQYKKENSKLKELRDELIANKRATTPGFSKTQGAFISLSGDIRDENFWRRQLDQEIHKRKILRQQLDQLQDRLNEVSDNKFGVVEETPQMRNIRMLENRLDKVMIKYNEAQSIRKTYEQIVKRLKEERVGYDNQLAAIERSLKGKEHDFEELLLLQHDATHAKELAQAELNKYQHKKEAVKELRKTYLEEKKKAVDQREASQNKQDNQTKDNDDKNLEKSQGPHQIDLNQQQNEPLHHIDTNLQKQKQQDYEEAFRKLYEATGVTDVNEIIQKFTTQEDTNKQLQDLKQEYSDKIEELNKRKTDLKKLLEKIKYEGGDALTRKQIDEIESNVTTANNKCERTKLKYERVSKILVNVKAGIEHIYEKLEFFKLEGKPNITVTDESLVEALSQIVEKMKLIYNPVKNDPSYNPENFQQSSRAVTNYINLNLLDKNPKIEGFSKNIRIKLPEKDDDEVSNDEMDEDIDLEQNGKIKQKYKAQANQDKQQKLKSKKVAQNVQKK